MHKTLALFTAVLLLGACTQTNNDPLAYLTNIPAPVCQFSPEKMAFVCKQKDMDNIKKTFNQHGDNITSINLVVFLSSSREEPWIHDTDKPWPCTLHLIGNRYGLVEFKGQKTTEYYICREDFDKILGDAYDPDLPIYSRAKQQIENFLHQTGPDTGDRDVMEFPTELSDNFYQPITDKTPKKYISEGAIIYKFITAAD